MGVGGFAGAAAAQTVIAPEDSAFITRNIIRNGGTDTIATARIIDNPDGDDALFIDATLQPGTRYTVFLGQSPTLGALPVHLVGEFQTDSTGRGFLAATLEVMDAFDSANPSIEVGGVADQRGAGALANGAVQIPMDFIRIYAGDGAISVFSGGPAGTPGGPFIGASTVPLFSLHGNFTLFDAATDQPLQRIRNGSTLSRRNLPAQLSVVYTTEDQRTDSVVLTVDNGRIVQTESQIPYALGGDDPNGPVNGANLRPVQGFPTDPGSYTMSVTRFPQNGANGAPIATYTVYFKIVP